MTNFPNMIISSSTETSPPTYDTPAVVNVTVLPCTEPTNTLCKIRRINKARAAASLLYPYFDSFSDPQIFCKVREQAHTACRCHAHALRRV